MRFTSFLTLTLVSTVLADFGIGVDYITAKNSAQLASITAAYASALESFQASMTAQPQWSSARSALIEYQSTGKDVPEDVTATDTILTYTTTPDWYNAMPTDLKNYYDNVQKEQDEIRESVVKAATGDATRITGLGVYVTGAFAALVVGVAVGL